MADKGKATSLMQRAINLLEASRAWEGQAFLKAQILGLQGEKRRERYEARKDYMLMQYLQCCAVDLFDTELTPSSSQVTISNTSIPEYFRTYLKKLWETYNELHNIANDLVVAGWKPIAEPLYCHLDYLLEVIVETKRTIKEGDLADWEYHHVSRYQVSNHNIHDCYEKKEAKQGYKY